MLALHVGAGPIRYPNANGVQWINLDISPAHAPDVCMDCTRMAEHFKPAFFDACLSIHHLEHLPYPAGVIAFLDQARQVLRPGGTLRIVVPDLMKVARKYVAGESLKDVYDGPYFVHKDCPAERFLWFMRGWEHTIVFDEQLLRAMLVDAGFQNVRTMPFGKSDVAGLSGLDRFESESLVMEGMRAF